MLGIVERAMLGTNNERYHCGKNSCILRVTIVAQIGHGELGATFKAAHGPQFIQCWQGRNMTLAVLSCLQDRHWRLLASPVEKDWRQCTLNNKFFLGKLGYKTTYKS